MDAVICASGTGMVFVVDCKGVDEVEVEEEVVALQDSCSSCKVKATAIADEDFLAACG